jgi:hypothetical protein
MTYDGGDRVQAKITAALRRSECRGSLISIPQQRGYTISQALLHLERKRTDPWLYKIQNKLSNAEKRMKRKAHAKAHQDNYESELNILGGDANSAERG